MNKDGAHAVCKPHEVAAHRAGLVSMKHKFYRRACCNTYGPWRVKWEKAMVDLEKVEAWLNCTAQIHGIHGPQVHGTTQHAATPQAPPPSPPPPPFPPRLLQVATMIAAVESLQEENRTRVGRLEVVEDEDRTLVGRLEVVEEENRTLVRRLEMVELGYGTVMTEPSERVSILQQRGFDMIDASPDGLHMIDASPVGPHILS